MIIKKILECRLDLTDPMDILDSDLIKMCMKHLTRKFVNRCFKSCLVVKINKILRHSGRYMSEDLSGSAFIVVNFEVDGIVFAKGEILNGCQILKIEADGRIHAKSKHAGIQVRQDPSTVTYKEGQLIPLIVCRSLYTPSQNSASVEATPFVPTFIPLKVYAIKSGMTPDDIAEANRLFARTDALIEIIQTRSQQDPNEKKAFEFFRDLIYPFKKPSALKLAGFEKRDLRTISQIARGYIYQPAESKIEHCEFYYSENLEHDARLGSDPVAKDLPTIYEKDLMFVVTKFLTRATQYYSTLVDFVDTYPTFAKVQECKDIWRMFNVLKK